MSLNVGDILLRLGVDTGPMDSKMSGLSSKGSSAGFSFGNAFSMAVGQALEKVGEKILEAVTDGAKALFEYQANMEQLTVGFTTMIGSAEGAKYMLEELNNWVAKTPFQLDQVTAASRKLLAFGWAAKDVIPTLDAVGNAAAALGLDSGGIDRIVLALGQMQIKAKLSGEEIRQLNEAGIGAQKYLADAFHLTAAQLQDIGKAGISGADAVKAIIDGMANDSKFKGMMEAQADTVKGMFTTVEDVMKQVGGYVTDGLYQSFATAFKGIRDDLSITLEQLRKGGAESFFNFGKNSDDGSRNEALAGMEKTFQLSEKWSNRLAAIGDTALKLCDVISEAFVKIGGVVVDKIAIILDAFETIKPGVDIVIGVFGILVDTVADCMDIFEQYQLDSIASAQDSWNGFVQTLSDWWDVLVNTFDWLVDSIEDGIAYLLTGGDRLGKGWADICSNVSDVFSAMKAWCLNEISELINGMLAKLGPVGGLIKDLAAVGMKGFNSLAAFIGGAFSEATVGATSVGNRFLGMLRQIDTAARAKRGDREKGRQDFENHKGTTIDAPDGGTGKKGGRGGSGSQQNMDSQAEKFEDKAEDIAASFAEKISKLQDSNLVSNLMGVSKEVQKAGHELDAIEMSLSDNADKYAAQGVDVSGAMSAVADARNQLAKYETVAKAKFLKEQELTVREYEAKVKQLSAEASGDQIADAEAVYEATKVALEKERLELLQKIGDEELVNRYITAQTVLAEKKRTDSKREALDKQVSDELERNQYLYATHKINAEQLNEVTRDVLQHRIAALQTELDTQKLTADEIVAVRKKIADYQKTVDATPSNKIWESVKQAIEEVKNSMQDNKEIIKACWADIDKSITKTFEDMFISGKSFGESLRGLFTDVLGSIQKMMVDTFVNSFIMNPVKNWWSNLVPNLFAKGDGKGSGSGSKPKGRASGGPVAPGQPYRWQEAGEEYFISSSAGTVLPHDVVSRLTSRQPVAANSQPVVNMYVSTPNADSFKQSQSQILADANLALARGRRNL